MARTKEIVPGFRLVKFKHKAFIWRGKSYNLDALTVAQAEALLASGWKHIARTTTSEPE